MARPVGELTLCLAGTVTNIRSYKASKMWREYWKQKQVFNTLQAEFRQINWDLVECFLDIKEAYKVIGTNAIVEGGVL